jgi:uncharacterized protein HemX
MPDAPPGPVTADTVNKGLAYTSVGVTITAIVYNIEKLTPFVREFGIVGLAMIIGMLLLGLGLYGVGRIAFEVKDGHLKYLADQSNQMGRLVTQDERQNDLLSGVLTQDVRQNDLLSGVIRTQEHHGEKIHETHILVRDIHMVTQQWNNSPTGT